MKAAVITYPGTSGGQTSQALLEKLGFEVDIVKSSDHLGQDLDLLLIADGSAYGGAVRPGAIASLDPISQDIKDFADQGKVVIGLGNGFQILTELNLLPGYFMKNPNLSYISKMVKVETKPDYLVTDHNPIDLFISNKQASYRLSDQDLSQLEANDQVLMIYQDDETNSSHAIAGVTNKKNNVFGLMPLLDRHQDKDITSDLGLRLTRDILKEKGLV